MNQFTDYFPFKGTVAGIGSRSITAGESRFLMLATMALVFSGYKFNSGGANGSDTSVEFAAKLAYDLACKNLGIERKGYGEVMRIYMPWNSFNGRYLDEINGYVDIASHAARDIAAAHYPDRGGEPGSGWRSLKDAVKTLMSRNIHQVLGDDLQTKVKFIFCHTPDGVNDGSKTTGRTGGTGQALRVAHTYGIPIFNMGNPRDKHRLQTWINEEKARIFERFGIDLEEELDLAIKNHAPFNRHLDSDDIFKVLERGEADVLIHGANCFNTMGTGIALSIKKKFPEAFQADQATMRGDKKKLGTYTFANVQSNGKPCTIVNAYTQYKYSRDDILSADYEAIRKVFQSINQNFAGRRIVIPKIGATNANGCWVTIANTIANELKNVDVTYVEYGKSPAPQKDMGQVEFDI